MVIATYGEDSDLARVLRVGELVEGKLFPQTQTSGSESGTGLFACSARHHQLESCFGAGCREQLELFHRIGGLCIPLDEIGRIE